MKTLSRNQPCGCIVCICEDEFQCQGCGAKNCGTHSLGEIPNPVYDESPAILFCTICGCDLEHPHSCADFFLERIRWKDKQIAGLEESLIAAKDESLKQEAKHKAWYEALMRIVNHGPIMGSTGEYREGQKDALNTTAQIAYDAVSSDIN